MVDLVDSVPFLKQKGNKCKDRELVVNVPQFLTSATQIKIEFSICRVQITAE
jgi:hypothetical protein